jgi:hypothetical protein
MARRSSQPLAEVRRQVLSHGRPTFQPVAHKLGLKSLKKPSFKTGTNLSKSTGSEKKARETTPTAETGSQPVNRSVRRATQFLGISGAERGPENVGPGEDGGGRKPGIQHSPLISALLPGHFFTGMIVVCPRFFGSRFFRHSSAEDGMTPEGAIPTTPAP